MAFCSNCGVKIEEGVKFCSGCGKDVSVVSKETVVPITQQQSTLIQTQSLREQKGINKILRIAVIVAFVLWGIFAIAVIINNFIIPHDEIWENLTDQKKNENIVEAIVGPIIFLGVLAISTILVIFGQRKNNRIMVLIAGIIYIFTAFGIPSAIMCFIAFPRMKKNN